MKEQKELTIYDLAERLGISIATVSRALNNDPKVSSKTKKKITQLAMELGYRHNSFASNLRKQKTNTIGVMVPKLNSAFITTVLTGIEKVATASGYDILIANASELKEKEIANANALFHKRVDGIIASLCIQTNDLQHFKPFQDKGIPVVLFDRVMEDNTFAKVVIDNFKCGQLATEHLIAQGCKRIAIATGSLGSKVYDQRLKGYKAALKQAQFPISDSHIFITDFSEANGVLLAEKLAAMKTRPDGLFITNDFVAAVCMHTLQSKGIKIPEDIAIVGFNNDTISRLLKPQLSTIHYPALEMGEIAANLLMGHFNGSANIKQTNLIVLRSEMLLRGSSMRQKKLS